MTRWYRSIAMHTLTDEMIQLQRQLVFGSHKHSDSLSLKFSRTAIHDHKVGFAGSMKEAEAHTQFDPASPFDLSLR